MIHKDSLITGVRQNKYNELIYRVKVKPEDYNPEDYDALHALECEGISLDLELKNASSTSIQPLNVLDIDDTI